MLYKCIYIPVTVCPTRGLLPLPFRIISFVKPIILLVVVASLLVIKELTAGEAIITSFDEKVISMLSTAINTEYRIFFR